MIRFCKTEFYTFSLFFNVVSYFLLINFSFLGTVWLLDRCRYLVGNHYYILFSQKLFPTLICNHLIMHTCCYYYYYYYCYYHRHLVVLHTVVINTGCFHSRVEIWGCWWRRLHERNSTNWKQQSCEHLLFKLSVITCTFLPSSG